MLDSELPTWRSLPPYVPHVPAHWRLQPAHPAGTYGFFMSVIPYTKAVETALYERIFAPFRDGSDYTQEDCNNKFLKDFMAARRSSR